MGNTDSHTSFSVHLCACRDAMMLWQRFLWLSMTPLAFPVVPDVYIMVAISSGSGCAVFPSQVNASSLRLMISNVSMSITRSSLSLHSLLSLGSSRLEMKMALLPE